MIRRNAEIRQRRNNQTKSNGFSSTNKMEIDQGDEQEGVSIFEPAPLMDVEVLEYGQGLQAEYGDSNMAGGSAAVLNELWSLLAYEDPLREPHLDHLLNNDGRVSVAEELNVAILCEYSCQLVRTSTNLGSVPWKITTCCVRESIRPNSCSTRRAT